VSDDQDGHLPLHGLKRLADLQFACHVDLAGGLVED
jgi:hypothetical protein